MRRIIFWMLTSLDGYFEGPNREIDWHNVDQEFNEQAIEFLNSLDGLLFGRRTYELMAGYWPTPAARRDDPIVAERMNNLPKIVFSRTLTKTEWSNTRLAGKDAAEEVLRLKLQPGKDLAIFGSSDLAVSLMRMNLIDEFRILVNPLILGGGKPLFQGLGHRFKLKLLDARTFRNGNVLLAYAPVRTEVPPAELLAKARI